MTDNPFDAFDDDPPNVVVAPSSAPANAFDGFDNEPDAQEQQPGQLQGQAKAKAQPKTSKPSQAEPAPLPPTPGVSFESDPELDIAVKRLDAANKKEGTEALNKARGDSFLQGLIDPQQYLEFGKGIAPGAVQFGATTLKGAAAVPAAAQYNAAAFGRKQIGIMNRIDRGETVPELDDVYGYQHMSPDQRAATRAEAERASAQFNPTPIRERSLYQAGEAVSDYARKLAPAMPGYDESTGRQLGEGIGSLLAGLPFAWLGPIPAATFFGAGGAGEAVERAEMLDRSEKAAGRPGLTEEQKALAALWGIGPGTTDVLPVEVLMGRLKIPGPFRNVFAKAIGRIGGQAFIEGAQEGGQQFLQNLIAKEIYAPEQDLTEDVLPNVEIGAGVGTIAEAAKELGGFALKRIAGRRGHVSPSAPQAEPQPEAAPAVEETKPAPTPDVLRQELGVLATERSPEADSRRAEIERQLAATETPQASDEAKAAVETYLADNGVEISLPEVSTADIAARIEQGKPVEEAVAEHAQEQFQAEAAKRSGVAASPTAGEAAIEETGPNAVAATAAGGERIAAEPSAQPTAAAQSSATGDERAASVEPATIQPGGEPTAGLGEGGAGRSGAAAVGEPGSAAQPFGERGLSEPQKIGIQGPIKVFGIPADGAAPYLMAIADLGDMEARAHQIARQNSRSSTQKLAGYELQSRTGEAYRFNLDGTQQAPSATSTTAVSPKPAPTLTDAHREQFRDILRSTTPRKQWAAQLGVDAAQFDALIREGEAEGLLRIDRNGVVRRTAKARTGESTPDEQMFALRGFPDSAAVPDQHLIERAIEKFGTTRDPGEAGYILPDGRMLDFSGRSEIARGGATANGERFTEGFVAGKRWLDHRDLGDLLPEPSSNRANEIAHGPKYTAGSTARMYDFMQQAHAVRFDDQGVVNVVTRPTRQQLSAVLRARKGQPIDIEISDPITGGSVAYKSFERPNLEQISSLLDETFPQKTMLALRGFYSPAIRAAEEIRQEKGTGEQFWKQITKVPGVKKDELDWMGLEEFLKDKKSVTKAEVLDFMRANQAQLDEKVLGENNAGDVQTLAREKFEEEFSDRSEAFGEWIYDYAKHQSPGPRDAYITKHGQEAFEDADPVDIVRDIEGRQGLDDLRNQAWDAFKGDYLDSAQEQLNENARFEDGDATKFSTHKVPGGENYRELLIRLPAFEARQRTPAESVRIDELNSQIIALQDRMFAGEISAEERAKLQTVEQERDAIVKASASKYTSKHFQDQELVHLRVDDRTGPNREKVLFINEVQSDLHQEGRQKGYAKNPAEERAQRYADLNKERNALETQMDEIESRGEAIPQDLVDRNKAIGAEIASSQRGEEKVVDAPFKGDLWLELALKRALQYATENGYDALSWARSDQIAKAVGAEPEKLAIQYDQKIGKFIDKYTKKWGGKVDDEQLPGLTEPAYRNIGQSAEELINDHGGDVQAAIRSFEATPEAYARSEMNQDVIRRQLQEAAKVKAESTPTNPILRITPEMRDSIAEGQPLFARSDNEGRLHVIRQLSAGRAVDVEPEIVTQNALIIHPIARRLPNDINLGIVSRLEPVKGEDYYLATFTRVDGSTFEAPLSRQTIEEGRAFFSPRRNMIASLRFGTLGVAGIEQTIKTLSGEVHHEVVHAVWQRLPATLRSALAAHAKTVGILDMPLRDYLMLIGDPSAKWARPDEPIREGYLQAYKGRKDLADLLNQEAVAHMVELHSHGLLTDEEIMPVKALLDAILTDPAGLVTQAKSKGGVQKLLAQRGVQTSVTETPAFKRWFGDSKVVDENGKPLVVYHGTARGGFDEFDTYGSKYGLMGQGAYFTENPAIASEYTDKGIVKMRRAGQEAQTVYPVYLSIKNPIDMDAPADAQAWGKAYDEYIYARDVEGMTNEEAYRTVEEILADEYIPSADGAEIMQDGLRAMGHDGITHIGGGRVDPNGVKHRVWIAFDPEQIKSAIGNRGTFDPNNPDIRFALRPKEPNLADVIADIRAELGLEMPAAGKDGATSSPKAQINAIASEGASRFAELYGDRITEHGVASDNIAALFRDFVLSPDELRARNRALHDDFADALDAEAPGLLEAIDNLHALLPEEFPKTAPQPAMGVRAMQATAGKIPDSQARQPKAGTERPEQSLADLIGAFNRALGLTVRQGRLSPALKQRASARGGDVRGQTSMETGVIRLRVASEIDTLAHEGGHALELRFKGELDALKLQHAGELRRLASPGPDALSEGFAEFFRRFVTNPMAAMSVAPGFEKAFTEFLQRADPAMLTELQRISDGYQAWIDAPSGGAVASAIATTVPPGSMKAYVREFKEEGLKKTFNNWIDRIYTAIFDDLHPMRLAVEQLLEIAKTNLPANLRGQLDVKTTDNAYKLLRMARDGYAAGHMDLLYGVHGYQSITPQGPSLREAIATAFGGFDKRQWNETIATDFGAYLTSRRMKQEWGRFRRGELSVPPDKFSLADHEQAIVDFESKYPGFRQGASQIYSYLNTMLRKKRDAGLIPDAIYQELIQRQDYVPVMRDRSDRGGPVEGRKAARKDKYSVIGRFRGSQRDVINPLESIANDTYETAMIIARNDALKALDALARAAGPDGGKFAERIPAHEWRASQVNINEAITTASRDAGVDPADLQIMLQTVDAKLGGNAIAQIWRAGEVNEKGEPIVYLWENGERIPIRLADGQFGHDMLHAITGLSREAEGWWVNLLSLPSTALRFGVTASLDFIGANFIRDQVSAWVLTRDFVPFLDGAKGIYNDLTLKDVSRIYSRVGGIMGGSNVAAQHESRIQREILQLRRKGIRFTLNPLTRDFWRMTEFSESGTRLAVFQKAFDRAKKDNLTDWEAAVEASFVARDYIDFGRHGSRMLAARRLVPFLNAALQGLDRGIRGLTGKVDADRVIRTAISPYIKSRTGQPLSVVEQGNKKQAAQAWAYMVSLGMIGLGLSLLYKGDEEYEEISDYVKATHWLIRVNGEWVRIPKPFEIAFFSNLVERTFDYVYKGDPTAVDRFVDGLFQITVPPHSIPGLAVTTELLTDYDFFSGRPIVGPFLKSLPPELQFNAYASEFGKWLGKQVNISPAYIDHFITGFGASYGREFVNASDRFMPWLGRSTGGAFGLPTGPVADAAFQDYFFLRRFTTDPARGSTSLRQFWDMMAMENGSYIQAANGYRHLIDKVRDAKGAQEFLDRLPDEERAYALLQSGNSEGRGKYRRLHPLNRAQEIVTVAGAVRREINLNRLFENAGKRKDGEQIALTPQEMRTVSDLLGDITMREARNALVALKVRGWEQKKPLDVDSVYAELKAVSPRVHDEFARRLNSKKIPSFETVVKAWPVARERILEEGQAAIISDLYERDYAPGEGVPLQ